MTELRFFVAGIPAPQGSMVCRGARTGGMHILVPSNQTKLTEWRKAIVGIAEWTARSEHWDRLDVAEARMIFRLPRPLHHYRTGRFADQLRPDAPEYPTYKNDGDKLVRAVFDALVVAAVVVDDGAIVTHTAAKRYCQPGQQPGVNIVLSAPVVAQTALIEVGA